MKKILIIAIAILSLQSCKKETVNVATFSGKIENNSATKLILTNNGDHEKEIIINEDGSFSDTLHIKTPGNYNIIIENINVGLAYLKNGYDISLKADNNSFLETLEYTGTGAATSNYLITQIKYGRSLGDTRMLFALDKDEFEKNLKNIRSSFDSIKTLYKDIDTTLLKTNDKQNEDFFAYLENNYDGQHARAKEMAKALEAIAKGKPSPEFNNFENFKGGKTSLKDLKGKYVYIDLWATWCAPCIAEIPALKSLEKQYHNKNIQFVSISIDDERTAGSWDNAHAKWKKMVADKDLTGVQLYAAQDLEFLQAYQVNSIPRFILIDPKGNIVDSNAPRPSDPKLITMFKELGI